MLLYRDALSRIQRDLGALNANKTGQNLLVAVTGYVASGKSRFCSELLSYAEASLGKNFSYLPFDLWINADNLNAAGYAQKFFLDDFRKMVWCIKRGELFMVPRYDIVKIGAVSRGHRCDQTAEELAWNGKLFRRIDEPIESSPLLGANGLYIEQTSGYPYNLFPATSGTPFLLDGTMVVPSEVSHLYDLKVFVQAPWPMRVARMMRRFNRREVFGTTTTAMRDYIDFLVAEARECADNEIRQQLDDEFVIVESVPETLSAYLDLAFLRSLLEQPNPPNWVSRDEIEGTMTEFRLFVKGQADEETARAYKQELATLAEAQHLLALPNVKGMLAELASMFQ